MPALRTGSAEAGAGMMEPIMSVEVVVSDAFVGAVLNDITGQRRGVVLVVVGGEEEGGVSAALGRQTLSAEVPLAEMVAYSTALRSITQGGGYLICATDDEGTQTAFEARTRAISSSMVQI